MVLVVELLIDAVVVAVLGLSVYTDLKDRKILNAVVVPAVAAGLVLNLVHSGAGGLLFSLKGFGTGMALLLIPYMFGGFGAGDVKLMGALGALKGALFVFKVFLATGIAGGILAAAVLIKQRRFLSTVKRIWQSFYIFAGSVFKVNTLKSLDKAEYHESLPYGLAIGIGTIAAYLVG